MRIGLLKQHGKPKVIEHAKGKLNSDINVTPLVDVCLVLLIIFMVVTPLLQKGVSVTLPTTDDPTEKPDNEQQLVLAVLSSKILYIGQQAFASKAEFAKELHVKYDTNANREVILKADQRLDYGEVLDVLKAAHEAGFKDVGLISERVAPEAK